MPCLKYKFAKLFIRCQLNDPIYIYRIFIFCMMPVLYCVYANPTYEVANKLICILYLVWGEGVWNSNIYIYVIDSLFGA